MDKYWSYLKEAFNATTTLAVVGSIKQTYKSGFPIYQFETSQQIDNPNLAAIVWFDQSGVVCKLIQQGD